MTQPRSVSVVSKSRSAPSRPRKGVARLNGPLASSSEMNSPIRLRNSNGKRARCHSLVGVHSFDVGRFRPKKNKRLAPLNAPRSDFSGFITRAFHGSLSVSSRQIFLRLLLCACSRSHHSSSALVMREKDAFDSQLWHLSRSGRAPGTVSLRRLCGYRGQSRRLA